jgi:hypothetical protein
MSVNNFNENELDISSLENGVYTIQVISEDKSVVNQKFTVLR